jgi:hypothetical protein
MISVVLEISNRSYWSENLTIPHKLWCYGSAAFLVVLENGLPEVCIVLGISHRWCKYQNTTSPHMLSHYISANCPVVFQIKYYIVFVVPEISHRCCQLDNVAIPCKLWCYGSADCLVVLVRRDLQCSVVLSFTYLILLVQKCDIEPMQVVVLLFCRPFPYCIGHLPYLVMHGTEESLVCVVLVISHSIVSAKVQQTCTSCSVMVLQIVL